MTGLHIALVAVSLLAAVAIAALIAEEVARREWRGNALTLRAALDADETELEALRGRRPAPDPDDLRRA